MKNTQIITKGISLYGSTNVDSLTFPSSGLDWSVEKNPLVSLLEGKYPLPIKSHMAVHRTDTNQPLGIVGSGYEPIQNGQMWEATQRSLEGVNHEIVGAGFTHGGSRTFLQVRVQDEDFRVRGDEFVNLLTFYTSHDGSSAFECFDTSVRIVCQNTLQAARKSKGGAFKLKVRHTRNASIYFENMMQHLERIFEIRRDVAIKLSSLAAKPMTREQMVAWATSFYSRQNKLTGQAVSKAGETVRLAFTGRGNRGQTAYDLLNGVTEMLTHGQRDSKRSSEDIFKSSEFGSASTAKVDAFQRLTDNSVANFDIGRGRQLIELGEFVNA